MSGVFVGLQLSKGNLCKQWYGESFRGREVGIKNGISGDSTVVLDKIIVKNTSKGAGTWVLLTKGFTGSLQDIGPHKINTNFILTF